MGQNGRELLRLWSVGCLLSICLCCVFIINLILVISLLLICKNKLIFPFYAFVKDVSICFLCGYFFFENRKKIVEIVLSDGYIFHQQVKKLKTAGKC